MAKSFIGKVVSNKMVNTVVVEVTRYIPHPKYKKLLKRSKKFKVALNGNKVAIGDTVTMTETKPQSKNVNFIISAVKKEGGQS
jgi:small subunit ribosomal protein S17